MNKKYICYCGLYCENCPVLAKVTPAAKALYNEMRKAGFEEVIQFIPGGDGFWPFLKYMAEEGICESCKDRGGDPDCAIRLCAQEKEVEVCALCAEYPCEKLDVILPRYPSLDKENTLIREQGLDAWGKLQDERRRKGFTYYDGRGAEDGAGI